MSAPYPWQSKQWAELVGVADGGHLGHALLFSGRAGMGLEDFALSFANRMLCEAPLAAARPCGSCRGCRLYGAGTHPDFKRLEPAEDGKAILIDQARELTSFYSLKAHYECGKIVLISPAEAMNRAAANAILKILEEPPAGALLLLVAHRFGAIPMTIRSRCIRVPCEQIDRVEATRWLASQLPTLDAAALRRLLAQTGGSPLAAKTLAASDLGGVEIEVLESLADIGQGRTHTLVLARKYAALPIQDLLRTLNSMTVRLILAKFGRQPFYEDAGDALDPRLQGIADHLNLKHLYGFSDLLFESGALLARQSGVRDADIAESLWLALADAIDGGS